MAVLSAADLKRKFENGDMPTAQDFADLIDSFILANQDNWPKVLPASSAQNLTNIPASDATTINVGEFNALEGTPQYVSSTSFLMAGNVLLQFPEQRRIRIVSTLATDTLTVVSSSYNSGTDKTTVNVLEPLSGSSLTACHVASVTPYYDSGSVSQQVAGFSRKPSSLIAASTLDIGFIHASFDVEGNTGISAISERAFGSVIRVKFNGTPTLTHGSTLLLKNEQDFDVTAGDIFEFERVATGWRQIASFTASGDLPVGTIIHWPLATPPAGYLKFSATAISRTRYAKLFALLGTAYGAGNGSTTFNIPDGRGLFARFLDDNAGIDAARSVGSTQDDAFESHTHTWTGTGGSNFAGGQSTVTSSSAASNGSNQTLWAGTNAATGGTETRPKNIAFLGCIKYQ